MKAKLSRTPQPEVVSGYVEHIGGKGTPKCSINDPTHRARSWIIGPGQKTPVIQFPKGHSLLTWIASKGYLRFVAASTMGAGRKQGPLAPPTILKRKEVDAGGVITGMGDKAPSLPPKAMASGVKSAPLVDLEDESLAIARAPEQTPLQMIGKQEASLVKVDEPAEEPEPIVEETVVVETPAVEEAPAELTLLDKLEAMTYADLKALADAHDMHYTGRSAKAIMNAIMMHLEEHPELTIDI